MSGLIANKVSAINTLVTGLLPQILCASFADVKVVFSVTFLSNLPKIPQSVTSD
jgi:putative exporter of polyketide antibiotics